MKETNANLTEQAEVNIFNEIVAGNIPTNTTLIYTGDTVPGYKHAPAVWHAVDYFMQRVCIVFFDNKTATVHHSEIER